MKYKITIEQIIEVDELMSYYENKITKQHMESIYRLDDEEKSNWISVKRPSGKKVLHFEGVYSQVVELDNIVDVIKAANDLQNPL